MRTKKSHLNLFILYLILFLSNPLFLQETRPVRDMIGFCWNAEEMNAFMDFLKLNDTTSVLKSDHAFVAAISPHEDYLYAGSVYFPFFREIRANEAVILGVAHGTVRCEIDDPKNIVILDVYKFWQGPYGSISVSPLREMLKNRMKSDDYLIGNKAHSLGHSIEALIPFLQYYNRDIKITPVMITAMSYDTQITGVKKYFHSKIRRWV